MAVNETPLHATHDELLIAAHAAGDLDDVRRLEAARLVASCSECALLFRDLQAVQAAVAEMPPARRRRDFRLTEAEAARLRPRGWRRFLVPLSGPRFAFTQPLGAGLAMVGIVGLLVATVPGILQTASPATILSTVGSAVVPQASSADRVAGAGQPAPTAGPSVGAEAITGSAASAAPSAPVPVTPQVGLLVPAPSASAGPEKMTSPMVGSLGAAPTPPAVAPPSSATSGGAGAPVSPNTGGQGPAAAAGPSGRGTFGGPVAPGPGPVPAPGPQPFVVASVALLILGAALFAGRLAARRLAGG